VSRDDSRSVSRDASQGKIGFEDQCRKWKGKFTKKLVEVLYQEEESAFSNISL
jgi:hypothetical protein